MCIFRYVYLVQSVFSFLFFFSKQPSTLVQQVDFHYCHAHRSRSFIRLQSKICLIPKDMLSEKKKINDNNILRSSGTNNYCLEFCHRVLSTKLRHLYQSKYIINPYCHLILRYLYPKSLCSIIERSLNT